VPRPPVALRVTEAIIVVALASGVARADDGRVELQMGLGRRDQTVSTRTLAVSAEGSALSDLGAAGAWFAGSGPFGAAGRVAVERFALASAEGTPGLDGVEVTGWAAAGLFALRRFAFRRRLVLEGGVGYGFGKTPVAVVTRSPAGLMRLRGESLNAHGPSVTAGLAFATDNEWFALELAAEALPVAFGARYDDTAVGLRRFGVRAGARLGRLEAAGLRWSGIVAGDLGFGGAEGEGVSIRQERRGMGVALRATWIAAAATVRPAPARLRIVVREKTGRSSSAGAEPATAPGVPGVPGIAVEVAGRPALRTDARGECLLEGLAAGPVALRLGGPGRPDAVEVVSFPAEGEARAEVFIAPTGPAKTSAVSGFVRSADGVPLAARVRMTELGVDVVTNARGAFRFAVPPGHYTLTIEADGFVSQTRPVEAGNDEERIYNVDLQRVRR
jgi:hypothetical protein